MAKVNPCPKTKTPVDKKYRKWIETFSCCKEATEHFGDVCAHHESLTGRGVALKCSDYETVPLCLGHHNQRHNTGRKTFWQGYDYPAKIKRLQKEYENKTGMKINE